VAIVDPQPAGEINLREQLARIDNLLIDSQKKQREYHLAVWQLVVSFMVAGAAIFAAGAAAGPRLLGH